MVLLFLVFLHLCFTLTIESQKTIAPTDKFVDKSVVWRRPRERTCSYSIFFRTEKIYYAARSFIPQTFHNVTVVKDDRNFVRVDVDAETSKYFYDYYVASFDKETGSEKTLIGAHGSILKADGTYLPRHLINDTPPATSASKFLLPDKVHDVKHVVGQLLNLDQMWASGFYHFLMEALPKLLMMRPFIDFQKPVTLNVMPKYEGAKDIIRLLGLENANFTACSQHNPCTADRILTTNAIRAVNDVFHVRLIRSHLLAAVYGLDFAENPPVHTRPALDPDFLNTGKSLRLLLVDRGRGQLRSLTNHDQLVAALRARWPDAELIVFKPLPQRQAIQIFGRVHLGTGPHGAGNQNSLFMHTGTPWIPITGGKEPKWYGNYASLAGMTVWPYTKITGAYTLTNISDFISHLEFVLKCPSVNDALASGKET